MYAPGAAGVPRGIGASACAVLPPLASGLFAAWKRQTSRGSARSRRASCLGFSRRLFRQPLGLCVRCRVRGPAGCLLARRRFAGPFRAFRAGLRPPGPGRRPSPRLLRGACLRLLRGLSPLASFGPQPLAAAVRCSVCRFLARLRVASPSSSALPSRAPGRRPAGPPLGRPPSGLRARLLRARGLLAALRAAFAPPPPGASARVLRPLRSLRRVSAAAGPGRPALRFYHGA